MYKNYQSAARSSQQPPAWAQESMTPAGWAHYHDLCGQAGAIPTGATTSEPARGPGGSLVFIRIRRQAFLLILQRFKLASTSPGNTSRGEAMALSIRLME